jgi:hypothetical protein
MAITNTALATAMSDLIAHWQDFQDEHQDWLAGTVGGGPNSDGKYPLTDYEDNTVLVTCPAQLEADIDALVDAGTGAVADAEAAAAAAAASQSAAATSATNAATSASTATTQATNASNSASAAASSAAVALAQAGAAATSATNAAASETAAELAETNAETAETNAAASAAAAAASAAAAATFDPALYFTLAQSETITGQTTTFQHNTPTLKFDETDAAADERIWSVRASSGAFRVATRTDADASANDALVIDRSGTTVTTFQVNATTLDLNGSIELSGSLIMENASPLLRWTESDAGTNEKMYDIASSAGDLLFRSRTDANAAGATWMSVQRTGTTIDEIEFNATALDFNATTADFSGAVTFNAAPLVEGGAGRAELYFQRNANASSGFLIQQYDDNGIYFWNYENAGITFATNNTTRMSIAAGGAVTVNGALAAGSFSATTISSGDGAVGSLMQSSNAASKGYFGTTTAHAVGFLYNAANVASLAGVLVLHTYGAGTLVTDASGNVSASSDVRLKHVLGDFTRGMADIRGITPIRHRWTRESGMDAQGVYVGFSAQNVMQHIPEAVSVTPRMEGVDNPHAGMFSLSDRPLMAAIINALKELDARTAALEAAA